MCERVERDGMGKGERKGGGKERKGESGRRETFRALLRSIGMQITDLTCFSEMYLSLPNWASLCAHSRATALRVRPVMILN